MSRSILLTVTALLCLRLCSADCLKHPDGKSRKPHPEPITVATRLLLAHAETRVTPVFPKEALDAKIDGSVIIAIEVDHGGAVTQTLPLSGPKLLYPYAESALRQWHFESFCMHGIAYTVRSAVEFQFRSRGGGLLLP